MAPAKSKMSKQEMKAPDEFQSSMGKVFEFFQLYGAWIAAGIGAILLAIVGGVLLSRSQENARTAEAGDLLKAFAPVAAYEAPKKTDDADSPDAAKAVEESKKKLVDSAAALDRVATAQAGKPMGRLALLGKAHAALVAGDADAARQAYQAVVSADANASWVPMLWESLGYAADAAGKRDEAERAFTEMTKTNSSLYSSVGYLHLGDLYHPRMAATGQPSDAARAREFYDKALKELSGEEALLGPFALLTKKTLQQRLSGLP
jgi:tetratricopeptide (TPR) repeat protein